METQGNILFEYYLLCMKHRATLWLQSGLIFPCNVVHVLNCVEWEVEASLRKQNLQFFE